MPTKTDTATVEERSSVIGLDPAILRRWKADAALCVSWATLVCLPIWGALQRFHPYYLYLEPPNVSVLAAALATTLVVALTAYIGLQAIRRLGPWVRIPLVNLSLLIPAATAFDAVRVQLKVQIWQVGGRLTPVGVGAAILLVSAAVGWCARSRRLLRFGRALLLCLAPASVVVPISSAWLALSARHEFAAAGGPVKPAATARAAQHRVVWLIFDELDESIAFTHRPAILALPEMDGFRNRAVVATDAHTPWPHTFISISSLMLGRYLQDAQMTRPDDMAVTLRGESEWKSFRSMDNIFRRVKEQGFRSGVAGWYIPYCRVIGADLSSCYWAPNENGVPGSLFLRGPEFGPAIVAGLACFKFLSIVQGLKLADTLAENKREMYREFLDLKAHAIEIATSPELDLAFIHLPLPHLPGFYDRKTGTASTSSSSGYIDNLALTDRTLGELLTAIERSPAVESKTAVLVTADHPFRWNYWPQRREWSRSDEALRNAKGSQVPFMLRFPQQQEGLQWPGKFETILTGSLVERILQGKIQNAGDAVAFLRTAK